MTDERCRWFRVVVPFPQIILVVMAVFFFPWVETQGTFWTLWTVCFENATAVNNEYLGKELDSEGCTSLDYTVPGYFEAMRGLSICLLVLCILQLNVLCDNLCLDKGKIPVFMTFTSAVFASAILGLAYDKMSNDEHWQGEEREVSLSVYFIIISLIISLLMTFVHHNYDEQRVREAQEKESNVENSEESEGNLDPAGRGPASSANGPSSLSKNAVAPAPILAPADQGTEHRSLGELRGQFKPRGSEVSPAPPFPPPPPSPLASPASSDDMESHASLYNSEGSVSSYSSEGSVSLPSPPPSPPQPPRAHIRSHGFSNSAERSPGFGNRVTVASFGDHSQMHNLESVSRDQLYSEDMRSASRASYRNVSDRQGMGRDDVQRDFGFLETMPSYTLPPSRDIQTPSQPPPSYDAAMRPEYLDLPPPPVVSVPISHFADNQR